MNGSTSSRTFATSTAVTSANREPLSFRRGVGERWPDPNDRLEAFLTRFFASSFSPDAELPAESRSDLAGRPWLPTPAEFPETDAGIDGPALPMRVTAGSSVRRPVEANAVPEQTLVALGQVAQRFAGNRGPSVQRSAVDQPVQQPSRTLTRELPGTSTPAPPATPSGPAVEAPGACCESKAREQLHLMADRVLPILRRRLRAEAERLGRY